MPRPRLGREAPRLFAPDPEAARDIKRELTDHTWCGVLVALIQSIEHINKAVDFVADTVKRALKEAVSRRFGDGLPALLARQVVELIVDKVWAALTTLIEAHFPLLGADSLRALRILALFACPSVEQHQDVYEHALQPLMKEVRGAVAEDTKEQIIMLFRAWRWRDLDLAA
jgi:hypothetical protein